MDEVILRFPTIANNLFKEIDNKGLTRCKEVSKLWRDFINDQKDLWLRKMRLQYEGPSQLWKMEGKKLKNKADFWTSNDSWSENFLLKRKLTFMKNISKQTAFTTKNDG